MRRKLPDSRPIPSDPRTLSCLNSSEHVLDMTSNHTFLLIPSSSSTNLNDKHIARLPAQGTTLDEEMMSYISCYHQAQLFDKQLVIQFSLMFRSRDPPPPSEVDALINPFAVFPAWPFPQSLAPPSSHSPSPNLVPMLLPSHGNLATSPNTPCLRTVTCACSRLSQPRTPHDFPQVPVQAATLVCAPASPSLRNTLSVTRRGTPDVL